MPVSKHNLWKRKKNGVMKLVRSHSDWLQKRLETKTRKKNDPVEASQWWDKKTEITEKPIVKTKPVASAKRTQIGKKI
jgi:hypothetical protein